MTTGEEQSGGGNGNSGNGNGGSGNGGSSGGFNNSEPYRGNILAMAYSMAKLREYAKPADKVVILKR